MKLDGQKPNIVFDDILMRNKVAMDNWPKGEKSSFGLRMTSVLLIDETQYSQKHLFSFS